MAGSAISMSQSPTYHQHQNSPSLLTKEEPSPGDESCRTKKTPPAVCEVSIIINKSSNRTWNLHIDFQHVIQPVPRIPDHHPRQQCA